MVKLFAKSLRRAREAEPLGQGAKPKCKASIKNTANSRPNRRGNIGIQSVDKTNVHALTMCGDIAAPEINGGSSLISRPVRGDMIPQYSG
ncbi:hypothetical protein Rumal_0970 [Ruminococcus albus 7 = DSM 20455]|uniref:Uncharacterized protein n=1 Tax=Ruminococcus albus (strain ATCC 27210 / DSM 20455 / JCM 14654 / NCDO 2250 / 7) TaxID=697329 RepID=E6UBE6_RUMA7|nr:hypothetical protein [Ruminococcus albus]ADU21496.1 hypothetical protein Rumal_0970 [Ruminococcus albus 7 = DSM 20455]